TVFGTASRNEAVHHQVPAFLATSPTEEMKQAFLHTHLLPGLFGQSVLARGISAAFEVGVVFALVALTVTLLAIKAGKSEIDPSQVPGLAA
ncbi:MAG: hypothetical protein ABJA34_13095, partial [Pseudonocardiales bacterium]